jgi:hypothetical protein
MNLRGVNHRATEDTEKTKSGEQRAPLPTRKPPVFVFSVLSVTLWFTKRL